MPQDSTPTQIREAVAAAKAAFGPYRAISSELRATFLDRIAARLEGLGDELLETAHRETNLPMARLTGERGRTCGQLRMFASLIRGEEWRDIRIETADPGRQPIPKPDLRRTSMPIGPVAVFGASNFPLAFSVAGGDTASALAAGCPVVAKAHPLHPETSRLAGEAISGAVADCELPTGTFTLVYGGVEVGQTLVQDVDLYAVAFTGSLRAGRALFDLAVARPRPIPVFAEMGSVNPLFVMPGALTSRLEALAKGYADSLTLGVGQFCTNPGVVVGLSGTAELQLGYSAFDEFLALVSGHLKASTPGIMLSERIACNYGAGVAALSGRSELTVHTCGEGTAPALFSVNADAFIADSHLREEVFGPAAIAVRCETIEQMIAVAEILEGQLTATVHFEVEDEPMVARLLPSLSTTAGRLVANGFPTGVEVNSAMQHGGPYPATTDSRFTSVGTAAIFRFVRPIAYQSFPNSLLPTELRAK